MHAVDDIIRISARVGSNLTDKPYVNSAVRKKYNISRTIREVSCLYVYEIFDLFPIKINGNEHVDV